ncbi:protein JASON isoform X3 [Malania oleifera]|uniref:protein JASON isoform X3 n=1 Tax=Malania oleifera TaxID=397392 RepID=UPI0025ADBB74|nr:protein JASON isoform X3 [Malania oleifera]XP_057956363.1 protein JASON isoform X3 [Malania oleifera]
MTFSSLGCDLGFLYRIAIAMGCLFGCFRIKDDHRPRPHLVSEPVHPKAREAVITSNRLSTLFLSGENQDSPCKDKENSSLGSPLARTDDKGLKDEAKFLKACGTLLETPAEIRKAYKNSEGSPTPDRDSDPSKFPSWLPDTCMKKLQLDQQSDNIHTPAKQSGERVMLSSSSEDTPSSCVSDGQNMGWIAPGSCKASGAKSVNMTVKLHAEQSDDFSTSSTLHGSSGVDIHCKYKSVHFECESSTPFLSLRSSSSEFVGEQSKKAELSGNRSVSNPSPYSTPLNLTDEMQTPGTVFPANLEIKENGKNARIRSQYVYSVLNPVENLSQWKVLKEEDSNSYELSGQLRDSLEQPKIATSKSEKRERETSDMEELKVEASLSTWLKPPPSIRDDKNRNCGGRSCKSPNFGKTPCDRPILGTVATHWNEEDLSHITTKWWDGNGIPNSTNKYKEDQKVSWHATPFEERLEKALSEESLISQRRHGGTPPLVFDENEECDTAVSQMQSLTNPKSVVSF